MARKRILVVGAGFAGAVVARELAEAGFFVDVIDKRDHIGGNAYDYVNDYGIIVHKYGPHLFHTNNEKVFNWLSKFTEWVDYKHKVVALLEDGTYVPFPVNTKTLERVPLEDVSKVFFEPYSKKMWGKYYDELSEEILNRVKTRDTDYDGYFLDEYQCMPKEGYTKMFEKILNHKKIDVHLSIGFERQMEDNYYHVFNSMPIDQYYNFCFGELPYRSIEFKTVSLPSAEIFPTAVVNFTDNGPFTRVTEWKKIPNTQTEQEITTLTFEEPCSYEDNGERFYPVKCRYSEQLYKMYKKLYNDKTTFIGRCGQYLYLDMHMVISSSLSTVKEFITNNKSRG